MSKPRVDPTFGISSVDVLILTERHPARRWREAQPGSCKERENLAGDAKGKGPSGANRKAESTDAPGPGPQQMGLAHRQGKRAQIIAIERQNVQIATQLDVACSQAGYLLFVLEDTHFWRSRTCASAPPDCLTRRVRKRN